MSDLLWAAVAFINMLGVVFKVSERERYDRRMSACIEAHKEILRKGKDHDDGDFESEISGSPNRQTTEESIDGKSARVLLSKGNVPLSIHHERGRLGDSVADL